MFADLRASEPHRPETLPHPNVQVVFEPRASFVNGVATRKFTRLLEGKSQVFGIKFRPGGFRRILGRPVANITNKSVAALDVIGGVADELESMTAQGCDEAALVEMASGWLRSVVIAPDAGMVEADQLVTRIAT